jgi:hypothetical protein
MGARPYRRCRLCLEEHLLCDSHLLPKSMFRILRSPLDKNPNPIVAGEGYYYPTSKQLSDYLLCEGCEQRFRRLGEDWVMANCYRDEQTFRIREILQSAVPLSDNKEIRIYSGASITELRMDDLVYFAISVFWRAAVHTWRVDGRGYGISLGPYEEPLRRFLRGETAFPDKFVLAVRVSSRPELLKTAHAPNTGNGRGFHFHRFVIPGLVFVLLSGGRIPTEHYTASTAPAQERYISIYPKSELADLNEVITLLQKS